MLPNWSSRPRRDSRFAVNGRSGGGTGGQRPEQSYFGDVAYKQTVSASAGKATPLHEARLPVTGRTGKRRGWC